MTNDKVDDLLEMSLDEQKDELDDLSESELKQLREQEERSTAKDRIDRKLKKFNKSEEKTNKEPVSKPEQQSKSDDERIAELEAKVNYLIEKCKTTSHEAYKDYEN